MKKNLTELVFILDRSGSMGGLEQDTIGGFNAMLTRQKEQEGEANVTTILFDHEVQLLHDRFPLKAVAPLTEKDYYVRGCTALLDAIGYGVEKMANIQRHLPEDERAEKVIFVITTDGLENASKRFSYEKIRRMIEREKEQYGWEFLFLGANMDAVKEAARFGIGADRAVRFENDAQGVAVNYHVVSETVSRMREAPCCASIGAEWKEQIEADIVGSPYEFDHNNYKHKDFPLLSEKSHFTDDTVMTAAVAVGLIDGKGLPERTFCAVQHEMRFWGCEYPHAGYGGMFRRWLHAENPKPYGSFGNGSAMRVSAAGWLFDTLDKTLEMAKVTAEVTHNHPEGIKGAQATAAVIFLARTGHSKPEIKRYVEQSFGYDLNRTCDEIRPTYHHVETCQETVPEAIIAFLESVSFEDALRNAVSLGGDSDTLACITGGIAEAFYGMPQELRDETLKRLPEDIREGYELFRWNIGQR